MRPRNSVASTQTFREGRKNLSTVGFPVADAEEAGFWITLENVRGRPCEYGESLAVLAHTSEESDGRGFRSALPFAFLGRCDEGRGVDAVRDDRNIRGGIEVMARRLQCRITHADRGTDIRQIRTQIQLCAFQSQRIGVEGSVEGRHVGTWVETGYQWFVADARDLGFVQVHDIEVPLFHPSPCGGPDPTEITEVGDGTVVGYCEGAARGLHPQRHVVGASTWREDFHIVSSGYELLGEIPDVQLHSSGCLKGIRADDAYFEFTSG
jgi:hypothetical protein